MSAASISNARSRLACVMGVFERAQIAPGLRLFERRAQEIGRMQHGQDPDLASAAIHFLPMAAQPHDALFFIQQGLGGGSAEQDEKSGATNSI